METRLIIGKAANLHNRVKQGLVKDMIPHAPGKRLRKEEKDLTKVTVRWAETSRPAAAEEELLMRHKTKHRRLPIYVRCM
jgi:hypothetical protein